MNLFFEHLFNSEKQTIIRLLNCITSCFYS